MIGQYYGGIIQPYHIKFSLAKCVNIECGVLKDVNKQGILSALYVELARAVYSKDMQYTEHSSYEFQMLLFKF